ncbi:hypothetical protein [Desulfurispira natronophila]|uniref:Uncharacterized protein n=1 Tax=Desulfurispira natronophila TaxID=682562 RepID=A0A7W8DGI3_9BACT|nr:hypothetical protein [Desulfurispira natronophila]MBB5021435.1 hypothetical protein [Desulfurispira natronophila]
MRRNDCAEEIRKLIQSAAFLRHESLSLGRTIHAPNIKTSRKLSLVVDYLELAARLSSEIEDQLQNLREELEKESTPEEEFHYQGDYDTIDDTLKHYLGRDDEK